MRVGFVTRLTVALWGAAITYGCAVGADNQQTDECVVGAEGCECTLGGACDPGLACLSEFCVDVGGAGGAGASNDATSGSTSSQGGAAMSGSVSSVASSGTGPASASATSAAATTSVGTSAAASSSTGGNCAVPAPTGVVGCSSCQACDAWPASWDAVPSATHYQVEFQCSFINYVSPNILDLDAELCNEVGMCAYCPNTVNGIWVKACDGTCCSAGTLMPVAGAPLACGGGCCV